MAHEFENQARGYIQKVNSYCKYWNELLLEIIVATEKYSPSWLWSLRSRSFPYKLDTINPESIRLFIGSSVRDQPEKYSVPSIKDDQNC